MDTQAIAIPQRTAEKWQETVNLLAEVVQVPAALVMRVEPPDIAVLVSSRSEGNPYEPGEKASLDTGLYCETVMRTGQMLLVPDALKDEHWKSNPDIRLGMVSYLGLPITWPNGDPFGTICVLDNKENAYNARCQRLMLQLRDVIESDLQSLCRLSARLEEEERTRAWLEAQVAERTRKLSEAKAELEREVAEHRAAEAALGKSRDLVQAIIDNSSAVVFVKGVEGEYLFVNRRYEELFHISQAAIIGRTDDEIFPTDQVREFRTSGLAVLAADRALESEAIIPHEDGPHTYAALKFPLRDRAGTPYAVCGIATDITERKRLEQQLQQSQKLESIGRLAGGVAHDFNNLLTVILGHTFFAEEALGPEHPVQVNLEQIRQAGQQAAGLTQQLLAFARRQVIEPRILDLNAVVLKLTNMLRRLIGEDIELLTVPAPGLWPVRADPCQIQQVLVNLAVNARDAMPAGGTLTIATATVVLHEVDAPGHPEIGPGEYVLLAVKDTGTGMADEVKAHLFEPFYTTKEQGKGTGLGLATCYGVVRQNRGHIELVSELGKGTAVTVYLPRAHGGCNVMESAREPAAARRGHETVLVVEDDPRVREFIVRVLRKYGYQVLQAADGEAALRVVGEEPDAVQVLLTDVVMPKMGGKELASLLQARRPTLKVLYMSGYAEGAFANHGALPSRAALLQKPFTPQMLAQRMRVVLDGEIREYGNGGGDG